MNGDLYLLGGQPAYATMVEHFVRAAGGREARISVLFVGRSPKSLHYLAEYRDPLLKCGASSVSAIMRNADGTLDQDEALQLLSQSTGIFIGGGPTPTYLELYATGALRDAICARAASGVPIAGLSAGALILPEVCAITPEDSEAGQVTITAGLGLVQGLVVGVHFSERGTLPHVLEAMAATGTEWALGLDEGGCAILHEGELYSTSGSGVHAIEMRDFQTRKHSIVRVA